MTNYRHEPPPAVQETITAKYADSVDIKGYAGGTVTLLFYHTCNATGDKVQTGHAALSADTVEALVPMLKKCLRGMVGWEPGG